MIANHNQHGGIKPYWHVLYVRQKYEKSISARLNELGVEHILPMTKTLRVYKSQRRRVVVPLFPGYLFLNVQPGKRHHVTNLNGVYSFVKIGQDFQRVKDREIENIRILSSNIDYHRDLRSEPYIQTGSFIEITEGPFCGMRGLVTGNNGNRILVTLDSIKTAISISLPQNQVALKTA
ncbi:MAG: UpxY family transcription antiterminator [Roseivirga sp.]|nr:UpxY family transcription antiterminator [Roseivirga sp.]